MNCSTSLLIIRPPSPDPVTSDRSIPFSDAIFLASGEALILPLLETSVAVEGCGVEGTGCGAGDVTGLASLVDDAGGITSSTGGSAFV